MSKTIQNFYKSTLSLDWSIGTGTFYVTTKPTITDGWLVISPNNSTLREIIRYTSTGTDSNGDYVVVSIRGVGGTSEQIHTVGEPIRMNITAEYWKDMTDAIDSIVAAGAPNADTTTKGLVEIATDAEVIAGTATGATGASLVATPSQIKTNYEKIVPIVRTYLNAASPATWTKPANLKYVVVEVQAGGGNGANGTDAGSSGYGGGGGGGGGYSKKTIAVATLGATETVIIGAATAASSFGVHATATAGGNGSGRSAGGAGAGSSGDINYTASDGEPGHGYGSSPGSGNGGGGGNTFYGGGGRGGEPNNQNGVAGHTYGGGGGGGFGSDTAAGTAGAGAAGIVIVTEFY